MGRRMAVGLLITGYLLMSSGGARAASPSDRVGATLDGRRIAVVDVGRYHCHDFRYPMIACFSDRSAVDRAAKRFLTSEARSGSIGSLATSYVRVFEHVSFAGASAYFSVGYPDLRAVGWNDRISSYIVVNGGSGSFYQHISYSGLVDSFCCAQSVTNVGATFNDTYSSVSGSA